MDFAKGHGTENDFVVLPDPDGALDLTPSRVVALCDRRRGLGADGVLRVVRWAALEDGPPPEPGVEWFMDYRNADGSVAEMCGNGVRVFARYLATHGLLPDGPAAELHIGTRAGVRRVRFADGDGIAGAITVDMGAAEVGKDSVAWIHDHPFPGVAVDVGNPHLACVIRMDLDELDLSTPPRYDAALFPEGVNIELVTPLSSDGAVAMRVYERGVGETRSCGTGTVAAAVAALRDAGCELGSVRVRTRGGWVRVTVEPDTTTLTGPAVLVAEGTLNPAWWDTAEDRAPE